MTDASGLYRAVFDAFSGEARIVDPQSWVPACPDWTIHDLLAHQVHQLAGSIHGSFPVKDGLDALITPDPDERKAAGLRQQQWIDKGVTARAGLTIDQLLQEWSQLIDDAPPECLEAVLPDAAVHLFDLFGVRGRRSHRDHPLLQPALQFWTGMLEGRLRLAGLDGIRVELDDGTVLAKTHGDRTIVVRGTGFEILRTIAGRRTLMQAESRLKLPRSHPHVDHLALYGWLDSPLDE